MDPLQKVASEPTNGPAADREKWSSGVAPAVRNSLLVNLIGHLDNKVI